MRHCLSKPYQSALDPRPANPSHAFLTASRNNAIEIVCDGYTIFMGQDSLGQHSRSMNDSL